MLFVIFFYFLNRVRPHRILVLLCGAADKLTSYYFSYSFLFLICLFKWSYVHLVTSSLLLIKAQQENNVRGSPAWQSYLFIHDLRWITLILRNYMNQKNFIELKECYIETVISLNFITVSHNHITRQTNFFFKMRAIFFFKTKKEIKNIRAKYNYNIT